VGESSGRGVGLPSILIVRVGLSILLDRSVLVLLSPSAWSSSVLAPSFLRWPSTLALPTQCFCFSALCSGPLRLLSLSLCSPTLCLCAHGCRILVYVDGWKGGLVSHFHTFHFHYLFHFNAVPNFLRHLHGHPLSDCVHH
jgi:hypothetical protein